MHRPNLAFSLSYRSVPGIVAALLLMAPGTRPARAISTELLMAPVGEAASDQFGYSVGTAGDINGDGFDDLIVSARWNDAGGLNAGRVYVYYGGPGADASADLTLTGETADDEFGYSVGTAGDVNGDGFDDVIVGSFRNDAGGTDAGRAYLFYGGPSADATADLTFTGEAAGDQFGLSVGFAGDVNGDGFDDLIVGATEAAAEAGRAYVFYGGPGADTTPDLVFAGEAPSDAFGVSVGTAGDFNGDGFDDLIIGATRNDACCTDAGRAYVFYGGSSTDAIFDVAFTGEAASNFFGVSVGTAGDINGDGFDDVIVGAWTNGAGGPNAGRAYAYYGGPVPDFTADLIFTGAAANDFLGGSVGTAGDVNGDGFDDLIVGARGLGVFAGRAYVYYGGPGADATADLVFAGEATELFASSVGAAGDVDGDGLGDIIVGATGNGAAGPGTGRAYVYSAFPFRLESPSGGEQWLTGQPATVQWRGHDAADLDLSVNGGLTWSPLAAGIGGRSANEHTLIVPDATAEHALVRLTYSGQSPSRSSSVTNAAPFRIVAPHQPPPAAQLLQLAPVGEGADDDFGTVVGTAGDVNGDGFDDLIVGAFLNDAGGADAGRAYVYYSGPGADAIADLTFTGEAAGDRFGISVGTAGDVNGDGFDDLIVGAHLNDAGGPSAGRTYIYYGGPGADANADLTFTGEAAGDELGNSVGTAGDVNRDGFDDLIVGAYRNSAGGSFAGRAYVYYGGPGADATADLVFTGESADDQFGISVGTAGDVNGDEFDDLIIGSRFNDAGGSNAGRAYIFYGGPGVDDIADLTFTGEAAGDLFGAYLGTAGDVNADGFDDLIVGAYRNGAGGSDAGRAYVFYGGPGADAIADLTLTGAAASEFFGISVGTAGDVNRDGFDDLIVGAPFSSAGGSNAGRAYVFYGGPGVDDIADLVLTGEAADDRFGISVGTAGDINQDGFDDLIVGAQLHDAAGSDAGRAYVYDCNRYHVLSPSAGSGWNVGAAVSITWLGAEPADVWLSVDGGNSYSLLDANVGGTLTNGLGLTVPHQPTRFAKIKVTPHDAAVTGSAKSDSLFTIEASIELLLLRSVPLDEGGVLLTWQTDPGPEGLAGYKVERSPRGVQAWTVLASRVRDTEFLDPDGAAGMKYRLTGINGLGEELLLGETVLSPKAALTAWPLPYRSGDLNLSFAIYGRLGNASGRATVTLHDPQGRLVRTIADGDFQASHQTTTWDGRDEAGRLVPSGVYFLRALSSGESSQMRLVVLR